MSARAFIAFLRCEATQAEERAKALRNVAANIENHTTSDVEASRSKSKRKNTQSRPKRQHTAYTMFVMESFEAIKKNNPEMPPKDIISMVARQWAQLSDEEKELWKQRALTATATQAVSEIEEELEAEYYVGDDGITKENLKKKRDINPSSPTLHKVKETAEV
mmetsp:Transcript_21078/g.31243  ORF Transcript_21078/g.31243 Transcript_21078/m.31243 type:complete len:163 (+) Transcript_21078:150-638(+)|eukprot:CAMPEP_0194212576 /NCGR_PEP_ID=MMETSP0156-20130528/12613_1 /TAXON_ID=33649 /ORGANISM="Thalassionema nitzschioides, Strain L26-B" /LENGTH=162 /DNA_ID=CAMNT_0038940435 /DNA_START=148 /DNA_END=636 /DNA_ORIENTATION=-